jgi:hypothetical protein
MSLKEKIMTTVTNVILNLTQHQATAAQVAAGVYSNEQIAELAAMTNFVGMPTKEEIKERSAKIAYGLRTSEFVHAADLEQGAGVAKFDVMVGGAPWFMAPLCNELIRYGFNPVFSFTERQSVDLPQGDGSVKKTAVFNHVGFIPYVA